MNYDALRALEQSLRDSREVLEYKRLKELVEENETTRALIKEHKRLQMLVQMSSMAGQRVPEEEMLRFQQISSLLYAGTDTSRYLVAEMRLQQVMADIYNAINQASGLSLELPGLS
ncbi:MAG: YlbF family regulator [Eubacteriales bacterium]|jgi:cell fate (sporulation/competence/biofilm development) regulator YlbF (YheA/YmcA/DUF963 family)|nr:YlbF family regulator [Eubacteriales bacterium]MDD4134822.1 YlbF family regulator [Eubacteriales bacterium]